MSKVNGSSKPPAPKPTAKADKPKGDAKADKPKGDAKVDKPKGDAKADKPKGDAKADKPKGDAKADKAEGAKQRSSEIAQAAKGDMGALPFDTDGPKERSAETQALLDRTAKSFKPRAQEKLTELADAGVLDAPSKRGEPTLGAQIARFLDRGGDPKLAGDTVELIADAGGGRQCRPNACAAATVEGNWAKSDPSEYFRAATDLATKGETTLKRGKDGKTEVKLHVDEPLWGGKAGSKNKAWIADNKEGSEAVQASVQAALMNHASAGYYDIKGDKFVTRGTFTRWGGSPTEETVGVSTQELSKLQDEIGGAVFGVKLNEQTAIFGSPKVGMRRETIFHRDIDGELDDLRDATAAGNRVSTVIRLPQDAPKDALAAFLLNRNTRDQAQQSAHAVTVTNVTDGEITFLDPEGGPLTVARKMFREWMEDVDMNAIDDGGIGTWGTYSTTRTTTGTRLR
jgi:hypothetical protein